MADQKDQKGQLKICDKGHKFYKSSDCPVCPVCEREKTTGNFLDEISAPARRALENKGINSLEKLSKYTGKEILALHGMGPSTLPKLKELMASENLEFKE